MKRNKKKYRPNRPEFREAPAVAVNEEKLLAQVWSLIEPLCEYEGMELVHVEYQREANGRVLRLYIDRPQGVTLDDCVHISRQASDFLDIELPDIGPYGLEVTSPGSDRPISKEIDFERFHGEEARIKTKRPINGRKNFKGILSGLSDGTVKLMVDGEMVLIPRHQISIARLINHFGE